MPSLQSAADFRQLFELYRSEYTPGSEGLIPLTPGFSGARVFTLVAPAGNFLLKEWPVNAMSPERWHVICHLLRQTAARQNTPLALPVPSKQGECSVWLGPHLYHLEPLLTGSPATYPLSEARVLAAARTLSLWHVSAANYVPGDIDRGILGPPRHEISASLRRRRQVLLASQAPGKWEDLAARVFQRGDFELIGLLARLQRCFQDWSDRLMHELQQSLQNLLPVQPVWRDLWRDHLLFVGEDVTGLIDPGACAADSVLTDITRLFGSLLQNQTSAWQTALQEYERWRPLSPSERQLLPTFDLGNLLLSAQRCFESLLRASDPLHPTATLAPRLRERLLEYLTRLEQYREFRREWFASN